jgi:CheY-like chemotaxis protein
LARILLVDDEPPLLKVMSMYLERLGYSVATARSTEYALAAFESAPADFAAAVLDATMPGLATQELALRLLKASPSLRVIVTSGYPMEIAEIEAAAPGRVACLPKPFTPEMLASLVEGMLAA